VKLDQEYLFDTPGTSPVITISVRVEVVDNSENPLTSDRSTLLGRGHSDISHLRISLGDLAVDVSGFFESRIACVTLLFKWHYLKVILTTINLLL